MLSYYIRDIYVSFSNTGYKTSEIYIESYVKDYKCRTLQKTIWIICMEMWGPRHFWLLWWRFLTTRTLEMSLQRAPLSTILYYDDWNLLLYILLYFHDYFLPLYFLTFPTSWKFCDITSTTSLYHSAILDTKLHKSILNTTWTPSSKIHNNRICFVIKIRCMLLNM